MKKLALLLGSLLVVGATAHAKEVVAAPVEVSKEVVVVAEPVVEVIVVEEAFRPTGYIGVEYRAYGETEGHGDKFRGNTGTVNAPADNQDTWNRGANNRARLQTTFGIQMTENAKLEGRIRDYSNLETGSVRKLGKTTGTETRLRYYYKHTDTLTSRLQYRDEENDSQNFEYMLRINTYKNKGGLLESLVFAPKLYHSMAANNGGNYTNTLGMNIEYAGNLPLGFTWDGAVYLNQYFYNEDITTGVNETKDKEFQAEVELYLYRTVGLYATEKYNLDFNFEGGYDPYVFRQYDRYAKDAEKGTWSQTQEKNTYSLYTAMDVSLKYQMTPAVSVKGGVGAEYRNWDNEAQSSANDWRWQPFAFVSMNAKF